MIIEVEERIPKDVKLEATSKSIVYIPPTGVVSRSLQARVSVDGQLDLISEMQILILCRVSLPLWEIFYTFGFSAVDPIVL